MMVAPGVLLNGLRLGKDRAGQGSLWLSEFLTGAASDSSFGGK